MFFDLTNGSTDAQIRFKFQNHLRENIFLAFIICIGGKLIHMGHMDRKI